MNRMEQPDIRAEARGFVASPEREIFDTLVAGGETGDLTVADIEFVAAQAIALARQEGDGHVALTDEPTGRFSVLAAVNDDRPFLFDSALAAAIAAGARIATVFHPILNLGGRKRSLIVFVIDPVIGEVPRAALIASLQECFAQGLAAVRDWRAMLARLKMARDGLAARPPSNVDIEEDIAFLDWLADDHFTFLGMRDYRLVEDDAYGILEPEEGSGLGILADAEARVLGTTGTGENPGLSAEVRAFLEQPEPLIITKSSARTAVHRRVHMDYVGVKIYDPQGKYAGEHRFVGLFTSSAAGTHPRDVPLLRRKLAAVTARADLDPHSHDGKALAHILDTFPRDELFQVSDSELFDTALGIIRLGGLPRVRLFLRFDRFDRFASVLVFAPRDHIDAGARGRIHAILARALNGRTSASDIAVDETALVRMHFIVGRNPGMRPSVDVGTLERDIAATLETWDDGLVKALCARHGLAEGRRVASSLAAQFPPGYRDGFAPHEGARDLDILVALSTEAQRIRASAYRRENDANSVLRLKLYVLGDLLPLSQSLPVFENCGLKVIAEDAFQLSFASVQGRRQTGAILDFLMEIKDSGTTDLERLRRPLEDVLHAVLRGDAENDAFNRLVIGADLDWREVSILRAVAKYLRQTGLSFSLAYMQQALARNPDVAALLAELFLARTDPARLAPPKEIEALESRIDAALHDVPSLDDDRIIRRLRNVIRSILRTNYFQRDKNDAFRDTLSFKLDPARLDELPAPRPWREIFVYSPQVEGVHLRFGRIARGGIRWSDRREDFRTEILGLVKAQQVKNAVIVPVGAKGGFFPKTMPVNPTRDESMSVGIGAYKTFINALLEITDNLSSEGAVIAPENTLRPDGDDPYLVVAADKGTATFSDIANGIAREHGFWLDDAFASGGSKGYDHKKMGITARGAWEAVKRHFRELGKDIQSQDFTVIGVGDMSGDVFGNGMLLSRHIRLLAAFDHRHIFLDPSASSKDAFKERQRLFALPRSSWDDYNKALIGKGGGVFARSLKEIPLSPEVKALVGMSADTLSPPALINALLKARTDLLWFGGIGTYIKASSQSHQEAGDRANDAVRVNGNDVRAKVVGEGANLGVTQLGRIEAARTGVRIDTDAVDNSAGVDTSDHEVNLKILLSGPVRRGELAEEKRDELLTAMTDDVGAAVLQDNYDQTLALSVAEALSVADLDAQSRFIDAIETRGKLDRAVEYLPSATDMKKLRHDGKGLTRPELCVLLAYAKLDLDAEILASNLPDEFLCVPALEGMLTGYFPPAAISAFPQEPGRHRLKREIISTVLTNRIVNLAGPVFLLRMQELSGRTAAEVARAFVIADGVFGLSAFKIRIDALDGKVEAGAQTSAYGAIAAHLQRVTPWFLTGAMSDLAGAIALYRAGVASLRDDLAGEGPADTANLPENIARDIAALPRLAAALDIVRLHKDVSAVGGGADFKTVTALYFGVARALELERLRSLAEKLNLPEHWDRLAVRRLLDDLSATQSALAAKLLAENTGMAALEAWAIAHDTSLARMREFLAALEGTGELSVAKLMLASGQIQDLA
jgi:glutamate dehydrogenase